jgi:hypothetical protein
MDSPVSWMHPSRWGVRQSTDDCDWGKIGELTVGDRVAMRETNARAGVIVRQGRLTGGVPVSTVRREVDADEWGHAGTWRERWTDSWAPGIFGAPRLTDGARRNKRISDFFFSFPLTQKWIICIKKLLETSQKSVQIPGRRLEHLEQFLLLTLHPNLN